MRRLVLFMALFVLASPSTRGHGLLIPEDKKLPPLAMLEHKVNISIDEQVAVTRVEQTFRNHTSRRLEATYIFPVPRGASVNQFTMWVNGKETRGELVEADKARSIYEGIVRQTKDPGLLEYMGNRLLRLRVFPVPAHGDQKVALSFTSVCSREGKVVEYLYPLKTDAKATSTLEQFEIKATLRSKNAITNVYSPTHAISIRRKSDEEVNVEFQREQGLLDKDFQLYYGTTDKDVGLTVLTHRPVSSEEGYATLLVSPRLEASKRYQVPRDLVLVLDTSGSMRGSKIDQARRSLKRLLDSLAPEDRFALLTFATTVNRYEDRLIKAEEDQLTRAKKWVDGLEATGGTAIHEALVSALALRPSEDEGRSFTVVFLTDGLPTIGSSNQTNPEWIVKDITERNSANTRIFTLGVGDDVNATMLDRLADQTRALSTYVRPEEDIVTKVTALASKISNPVLTNLKLVATADVRLSEVYPVALPDLFHGGQLVLFARYRGHGPSAIKLTGQVGMEEKEFVFDTNFPEKTDDQRDFVEHLWARRKVGFLLDQIRVHGEKKELVDEVVALAKRYGITTPYTSYLIVPDTPTPVVRRGGRVPGDRPDVSLAPTTAGVPLVLNGPRPGTTTPVETYARLNQRKPGELARNRGRLADDAFKGEGKAGSGAPGGGFGGAGFLPPGLDGKEAEKALKEAGAKKGAYDKARDLLREHQYRATQAGKLGVDLSVANQSLRRVSQMQQSALRMANGRQCMELGGIWIDQDFTEKTPAVAIKAQSEAYFQILRKHPEMKDVFRMGNFLVWITPSGKALVIDLNHGKEKLTNKEIEALFVAKK
jgi:Ca-activated chloride channel family protein